MKCENIIRIRYTEILTSAANVKSCSVLQLFCNQNLKEYLTFWKKKIKIYLLLVCTDCRIFFRITDKFMVNIQFLLLTMSIRLDFNTGYDSLLFKQILKTSTQ